MTGNFVFGKQLWKVVEKFSKLTHTFLKINVMAHTNTVQTVKNSKVFNKIKFFTNADIDPNQLFWP